jgi:hypothetical protein
VVAALGAATGNELLVEVERRLLWPRGTGRPPVPPEVPPELAADYSQACLIVGDSPKAAAALARSCLQHLLRTAAGVNHSDLAKEIQEVLDGGQLPSWLAEDLDAVRNIGNFAAHPLKSTTTGEIVAVELGEAEWALDVLESLFDFYFVGPAKAKAKRDALNAKLNDAGKPPMK